MTDNTINTNTDTDIDTAHTDTVVDTDTITHANSSTVDTANAIDNAMLDDSADTDSLVLSTIDNPYNPKTDYDNWKQWDEDNGYNTESYIARLIDMEEEDYDVEDELTLKTLMDKVIQDILENDVLDVYCLV